MRIGLSFDQGTPKYRLYLGALLAAAESAGLHEKTEVCWLAGAGKPLDDQAIDDVDAVLLTGGADVEPHRYGFDDPQHVCATFSNRDEAELVILDVAMRRRLPILAICRGMQLLNVYRGGTLAPDIAAHSLPDETRHSVTLEPGSLRTLLASDSGGVTSSHHQAIERLGEGLSVAARAPDGTIEAIEWAMPLRKPWLVAVQWHPERMGLDEAFAGPILCGFLEAVRARAG